jgi:hypothetical protein
MTSPVRRTPRARLRAEGLEDRTVPSVVPSIAWYQFASAGPATTLTDVSGRGFNAAATGATFAPDRPPGADYIPDVPLTDGSLRVDGNFGSGGVTTANDLFSNADILAGGGLTMETWFKREGADNSSFGFQKLFQAEIENFFFPTGSDQLGWSDGVTAPPLFATVPVGEWHHAAAVFQPTGPLVGGGLPGTLRLYLDGQLLHTQPETLSAGRDNGSGPLYIGRANIDTETFHGLLFETRIALAALAPAQFLLPVIPPANQAPTADAGGPYALTYGGSVTLSGSGTDADGDSLTYTWTVNGQSGAASGAGPTLNWSALQALGVTAAGTYAVQVTADDGRGGVTASVEVSLTVNKANSVVTVNGGSFIYDGLAHPATGSVTGVLGESLGTPGFSYSYTDNAGNVVTTTAAPVEPGYYTVTASFAGNGNYNSGSAAASLLIAFEVRTLTDLSKAFNAGRTIPIKVQLVDAAGTNVSSAGISVTALRLNRVNADGTRTAVALQDAGNANPGNLFRYDAALGGYIFNLSTKGLGAGTYEFSWSAEGDPTEHTLGFRLV